MISSVDTLFTSMGKHLGDNYYWGRNAVEAARLLFDPTAISPVKSDTAAKKAASCWQFRPFRELAMDKNKMADEFKGWPDDSFVDIAGTEGHGRHWMAHSTVRGRLQAYVKLIVMKYIQALIAVGDVYFRQGSMEQLPPAIKRYVKAARVLEPEPHPSAVMNSLVGGAKGSGRYISILNDFDCPIPYQRFLALYLKALELSSETHFIVEQFLLAQEKQNAEALYPLKDRQDSINIESLKQIRDAAVGHLRYPLRLTGDPQSRVPETKSKAWQDIQQAIDDPTSDFPCLSPYKNGENTAAGVAIGIKQSHRAWKQSSVSSALSKKSQAPQPLEVGVNVKADTENVSRSCHPIHIADNALTTSTIPPHKATVDICLRTPIIPPRPPLNLHHRKTTRGADGLRKPERSKTESQPALFKIRAAKPSPPKYVTNILESYILALR
ncbi:unnamed protein product [Fusarium fujikuroi]|nr:unnamed protein product [Fusarium fujikuroi]